MMDIKETGEIVNAIALILHGVGEARADDGKVSYMELAMLATSVAPAVIMAARGASGAVKELATLDKEELDALYFGFLKTLEWDPTDDTRDKFSICYDAAAALVVGAIKWRNTTNPPKATTVP